jgi:hypothetical protein
MELIIEDLLEYGLFLYELNTEISSYAHNLMFHFRDLQSEPKNDPSLEVFTSIRTTGASSADGTALRFGAQGPGFKPGLSPDAHHMPSLSASLAV